MKKIIIAMAAVAVAFTMASCNKEQFTESGKNAKGNCIVTASTESALTKTTLNGNDTEGYDVVWSEDDTFMLEGGNTFTLTKGAGTACGTFQGNVPAMNGWRTAYYPASYDGSNWPVQTYAEGNIIGSPMKAVVYCWLGTFDGGKAEFKNVGGILRLTVKGTAKVTRIMVCTDNTPNSILDCGDGVDLNNTNGTVFHIAVPAGTHSGTSILFKDDNGKCCIKTLKSDLVINRSEITTASVKVDKWSDISEAPEGALSGTFTVSAEKKKVFFSKGNLYWSGSVYGFENNQYDINVAGHQSSFFWSNKAEYARGAEWNLDFNAPMAFFTNANDITANPGFTANGQAGLWRTLSKDEWSYLVNRKNGIGEATINNVKGVIIFHDDYDGQTAGLTSIPEGCVFLPAGGVIAHYWSSTSLLDSSSIPTAAALRYENGAWPPYVVSAPMLEKHNVRLVTDVPDDPAPKFTVTFDMNGKPGTAPEAVEVSYHATITPRPADPTTDGYTFCGWYKDKDCTLKWDLDKDAVTSDITLYARWHIDGALFGTFTVNDSGRKVYFSRGNLWYGKTSEVSTSATFNFEENQYDHGVISGNFRNDNHISHFTWSKDADIACALEYDDPLRSKFDVLFTNGTQTTPNPDFTVNGQKGWWRTLSFDEWNYLISNNGCLWACVKGMNGLIIFCDEYTGVKEGAFSEIPDGCAFLPAAGYRTGIGLDPAYIGWMGQYGNYWYSTPWDTAGGYYLRFKFDETEPWLYDMRFYAHSLRLVVDVTE